jgi:hypothetical protein
MNGSVRGWGLEAEKGPSAPREISLLPGTVTVFAVKAVAL